MTLPSNPSRRFWPAVLGGLCCAFVFACAGSLWAQPAGQEATANPNQQARALARKLGRERSVEGLETIIGTRNIDLLGEYERGFRETSMQAFSDNKYKSTKLLPEIEALIVKHYHDPQVGGALRALCASNGTKYHTRALFDLMYTEWRSGQVRASTYPMRQSILQTDLPGIEAPLLELLQTPGPINDEDMRWIIRFLGDRRYRPAVPVLIALQKDAKPNAAFALTVNSALLKIGTADATTTVLSRLAWLRGRPLDAEVTKETEFLISQIAQTSEEIPLDYAEYKRALPAVLSDGAKASLITTVARRKEKRAVPDLLPLLAEAKFYTRAFETLVAFESVDVWTRTRAEIERLRQQGKIDDGQYRYGVALLDKKIANPAKHFADKKQLDRQNEFTAKKSTLYATKQSLLKLKDSQPEQYVAAYLNYLKSQEQLAEEYADLPSGGRVSTELSSDYFSLANLVRFKLKQPVKAIDLYGKIQEAGNPWGQIGAADTYQFDLHDTAKAAETFQRLLEKQQRAPASRNRTEARFGNWQKTWLTHQVNFLKTGKPFSGTIGLEDMSNFVFVLYFSVATAMQGDFLGVAPLYESMAKSLNDRSGGPQINRQEIAEKLETLPQSHLTVVGTMMLLSLLPDAGAILRYLEKHDPAGYLSACLFAAVQFIDRQDRGSQATTTLLPGLALDPSGPANPFRMASERFLKERRVKLEIPADPRWPTP